MRFFFQRTLGTIALVALGFGVVGPVTAHAQLAERSQTCSLSLSPEEARSLLQGLARPGQDQFRTPQGEVSVQTSFERLVRSDTMTGFRAALITNQTFTVGPFGTKQPRSEPQTAAAIDSFVSLDYDEAGQRLQVTFESIEPRTVSLLFETRADLPLSEGARTGSTFLSARATERTTGRQFSLRLEEERSAGRRAVRTVILSDGRLSPILFCAPERRGFDVGLELRIDFDLAVEIPGPGSGDEHARDSLRILVSGEDRSDLPRGSAFPGVFRDPSLILPFSEAQVLEVPRDLVTRRIEVHAAGAGLAGGLRVSAAPTAREVVRFLERPAFQFTVRANGEPIVALDASAGRF